MNAGRAGRRRALTLSWLLVLSVLSGLVPFSGTAAAVSPGGMAGNGTVGDPYVVTDVTQLQAVDQDLSANYTLGNDVDASATAGWNGGDGLDPLGDSTTPFTGSFDGAGHTVSDLTVSRETDYVGLFGFVASSGAVSDVHVTGSVDGRDYVGGLAGKNTGSVSNASTNVTVNGRRLGGGLVGENDGPVSNASATGNVTGSINYFGGLIGYNRGGDVSNSSASGTVTSTGTDNNFGGLIGYNYAGAVSDSHASGDVVASSSSTVAGLIGQNHAPVSNSTASGRVTGDTYVGGLVGYTKGAVSNSSATGNVTGSSSVGGLVGRNQQTQVSDSFATGNVTGSSSVGGLVGYDAAGTVTDSYWDTETTGQATSAGGTGLTTAQMTGAAAETNMSALDFTNTWTATKAYPRLQRTYTPPIVSGLAVTNSSSQDVEIEFTSSQPLATLSVSISGAESATLSLADVTETDNGDGTYTYAGTYATTVSGTYTATVDVAANSDGDDGLAAPSDSVSVDTRAPTADAGANRTVDVGDEVGFDGSNSTDDTGVVGYAWSFGDGSPSETGATATHTYAEEGRYQVVLTASDAAGNAGTDTLVVTVRAPARSGGDGRGDGPASPVVNAPLGGSVTKSGTRVSVDFGGRDEEVVRSTTVEFGARDTRLVAVERVDEQPTDVPATHGRFVGAVELTVSKGDAETPSTLQFGVSRTSLDTRGVTPDRLQIEHYDDETGQWEPLETTVVERGPRRVLLRTETPGFSMFAVTARPPAVSPSPSPVPATVTSASPSPSPSSVPTTEATTSAAPTPADPSSTSSETPGFGFGVAAAALLLVVVVAGRRLR